MLFHCKPCCSTSCLLRLWDLQAKPPDASTDFKLWAGHSVTAVRNEMFSEWLQIHFSLISSFCSIKSCPLSLYVLLPKTIYSPLVLHESPTSLIPSICHFSTKLICSHGPFFSLISIYQISSPSIPTFCDYSDIHPSLIWSPPHWLPKAQTRIILRRPRIIWATSSEHAQCVWSKYLLDKTSYCNMRICLITSPTNPTSAYRVSILWSSRLFLLFCGVKYNSPHTVLSSHKIIWFASVPLSVSHLSSLSEA